MSAGWAGRGVMGVREGPEPSWDLGPVLLSQLLLSSSAVADLERESQSWWDPRRTWALP